MKMIQKLVLTDWISSPLVINYSYNYNITTTLTTPVEIQNHQITYANWALILAFFPIFTIFGNILVILSVVREKSLRTTTNYFIVSLAFADIFVATLVMPFAVYIEFTKGTWKLGETLCDFYIASDVCMSTSSILNLVAISVDRFIAVTKPIKYSKQNHSKRVPFTIGICWGVSAAIAVPILFGLNNAPDRDSTLCIFYNANFILYSSLSSFYIPCFVMMYLYTRIFSVLNKRARKAQIKFGSQQLGIGSAGPSGRMSSPVPLIPSQGSEDGKRDGRDLNQRSSTVVSTNSFKRKNPIIISKNRFKHKSNNYRASKWGDTSNMITLPLAMKLNAFPEKDLSSNKKCKLFFQKYLLPGRSKGNKNARSFPTIGTNNHDQLRISLTEPTLFFNSSSTTNPDADDGDQFGDEARDEDSAAEHFEVIDDDNEIIDSWKEEGEKRLVQQDPTATKSLSRNFVNKLSWGRISSKNVMAATFNQKLFGHEFFETDDNSVSLGTNKNTKTSRNGGVPTYIKPEKSWKLSKKQKSRRGLSHKTNNNHNNINNNINKSVISNSMFNLKIGSKALDCLTFKNSNCSSTFCLLPTACTFTPNKQQQQTRECYMRGTHTTKLIGEKLYGHGGRNSPVKEDKCNSSLAGSPRKVYRQPPNGMRSISFNQADDLLLRVFLQQKTMAAHPPYESVVVKTDMCDEERVPCKDCAEPPKVNGYFPLFQSSLTKNVKKVPIIKHMNGVDAEENPFQNPQGLNESIVPLPDKLKSSQFVNKKEIIITTTKCAEMNGDESAFQMVDSTTELPQHIDKALYLPSGLNCLNNTNYGYTIEDGNWLALPLPLKTSISSHRNDASPTARSLNSVRFEGLKESPKFKEHLKTFLRLKNYKCSVLLPPHHPSTTSSYAITNNALAAANDSMPYQTSSGTPDVTPTDETDPSGGSSTAKKIDRQDLIFLNPLAAIREDNSKTFTPLKEELATAEKLKFLEDTSYENKCYGYQVNGTENSTIPDLSTNLEIESGNHEILMIDKNLRSSKKVCIVSVNNRNTIAGIMPRVTVGANGRRTSFGGILSGGLTSLVQQSGTKIDSLAIGSVHTVFIKKRRSYKKKERIASKERRATQTLAIVLLVFLVSWVPFFSIQILNAICQKIDYDPCKPSIFAFTFTTWIGYLNSLMNPAIYTIFNVEFRKAFKKLLHII